MPTTAETIEMLASRDQTALIFADLAEQAARSRHTLLGTCPHCSGNVVLRTMQPKSENHANCLQCARDLCCPAINLPNVATPRIGSDNTRRQRTSPRGTLRK